jgi:hypothetical protein
MGHKWTSIKPPDISKPTLKRHQKGSRELLKGRKWGEFSAAPKQELIIEGEEFKLRIGFFFNIRACCILHKGKYVVLRKISTKDWGKYTKAVVLVSAANPFPDLGSTRAIWGREPTGNWWYLDTPNRGMDHYTSQPPEGFVLARSKSDILRRG